MERAGWRRLPFRAPCAFPPTTDTTPYRTPLDCTASLSVGAAATVHRHCPGRVRGRARTAGSARQRVAPVGEAALQKHRLGSPGGPKWPAHEWTEEGRAGGDGPGSCGSRPRFARKNWVTPAAPAAMASGAALSEALNETVKASFLLRSSLVQEEAVFLVLTTANIHVVDLDLAGPRGRGGVHLQSPLSSLNNVDVNETDNDSFTLQCGDGVRVRGVFPRRFRRPASRPLTRFCLQDLRSASFTSAGRDDVLKELQVLWRACTMVTDFEVGRTRAQAPAAAMPLTVWPLLPHTRSDPFPSAAPRPCPRSARPEPRRSLGPRTSAYPPACVVEGMMGMGPGAVPVAFPRPR